MRADQSFGDHGRKAKIHRHEMRFSLELDPVADADGPDGVAGPANEGGRTKRVWQYGQSERVETDATNGDQLACVVFRGGALFCLASPNRTGYTPYRNGPAAESGKAIWEISDQ